MIIAFVVAWSRRKDVISKSENINTGISVVIAARNEEENIESCLKSLLIQKFQNFEIIVVDDHSNDNTANIIKETSLQTEKVRYYLLPDLMHGKKQALNFGVSQAKNSILFFTDADCTYKQNHLKDMAFYFLHNKITLLCGPVDYNTETSLITKLFNLEFLSLTGSGAAAMFLQMPFICNAANMMIYKSIFVQAQKEIDYSIPSGDDVFLLHFVSKNYKTDFIKSNNCIVKTKAPISIKQFVNQRIRWASKSKKYKDKTSVLISMIVFLVSFLITTSFILAIFSINYLGLAFSMLLMKFIVDFLLLHEVCRFYNKPNLVYLSPILAILYPFYIVIVGILSFFKKYNWKDRLY